jgi:hypothetical protein
MLSSLDDDWYTWHENWKTDSATTIGKQQLQYMYQGCFNDNAASRDINGYAFPVDNSQTLVTCITACQDKGFAYAGVQSGNMCMCSNNFGNYGGVETSKCNIPCPGQSNQMCGGNLLNSVFSTTDSESAFCKLFCLLFHFMKKKLN